MISEMIICTPYQAAIFHVTLGDGEILYEQCRILLLIVQ
jgi:hypothetical protein